MSSAWNTPLWVPIFIFSFFDRLRNSGYRSRSAVVFSIFSRCPVRSHTGNSGPIIYLWWGLGLVHPGRFELPFASFFRWSPSIWMTGEGAKFQLRVSLCLNPLLSVRGYTEIDRGERTLNLSLAKTPPEAIFPIYGIPSYKLLGGRGCSRAGFHLLHIYFLTSGPQERPLSRVCATLYFCRNRSTSPVCPQSAVCA